MAVLTPLVFDDAKAVVDTYDCGSLVRVTGLAAGSVNSNFEVVTDEGRFFLRLYEEQDRTGAETDVALLAHLAAAGVPTPRTVVKRDGGVLSLVSGKPAVMFPWVDGLIRCQARVSTADCAAVGRALAGVHAASAGAPIPSGRFGIAELGKRLTRIEGASDPALRAQAEPLRRALDTWWGQRDGSLPRGLIHGDLFRDNVLFRHDGELAVLLDFESASEGVFAYDLMVTALAWCFGDGFDVALFEAMRDGYESRRPLNSRERAGLRAEACCAAIRFTITRITDYAMRDVTVGPRVVKDYRRFLARLEAMEKTTALNAY